MDNSLIGNKKDGGSYKVLIIDDSLFFIKHLSNILESEGFEIIAIAEDGEKGVEKYKAFYPNIDFVTLDIKMSNGEGMEALKEILEFDKNARVLMISAIGKESIIKDALLIGAKDFIMKPIDKDKIIPKIKKLLDKF